MGPLVLSITLRPYSHSACSSSVYYYCPSCLRCGCFSSRLASCCVSARSIVALGTVGALQCARAVPGVRLGVGFWLFRLLEAASRVGLWRSGGGIEGFGLGLERAFRCWNRLGLVLLARRCFLVLVVVVVVGGNLIAIFIRVLHKAWGSSVFNRLGMCGILATD